MSDTRFIAEGIYWLAVGGFVVWMLGKLARQRERKP